MTEPNESDEISDQLSTALTIRPTADQSPSDDDDDDEITINDHFLVFDHKTEPQPNHWHILPSSGHTPLARVGHSAVFLPSSQEGTNGSVVSIGGANPDGTFSEVNILDLNTLRWDLLIPPGFRPRYEHSAFSYNHDQIYVFGGADMVENMNDFQVIDLSQKTASTLPKDAITGAPPCPRTYRSHSDLGSQFFVFGGGKQGSDPVSDKQTRVFDVATKNWTGLDTKGQPPKTRQGHSCVAICYKKSDSDRKCLFVHGGMAGSSMYDDVHLLDLDSLTWSGEVKVPKSKPKPSPRAAHVALPYKNNKVVIFGGLGRDNVALNDLWLFDVAERQWRQIEAEGAIPPARLDSAACIVTLSPKDSSSSSSTVGDYLLITGGMNTEGDVFSDCFIFRLDTAL